MAGKYQAYSDYKDSETDWMGLIPSNWDSVAIGRLFTRVKRTDHVDKELLSVYRDHGVVPTSSRDDNNNKPSDDLSPYQLVQPNDLVLNKMKTWQGSIAISEYEGIVSPAYFVYKPNAELFAKAHPKYIHYLLRNPLYIAQYLSRSKGIRVNQWDLDPDEFKCIELLLPSKDEQSTIINFLDHETAKIDTLIDKQQQLIKLLKEKRQAVISHAVTKGLNPAAPMKDSGVEWLGEVPEHWGRAPLKHLAKIRYGIGEPPKYVDDGAPLVRATNIRTGSISAVNLVYVNPNDIPANRIVWLEVGDIIVVRSGAGTGDSSIIPKEYEGSIAGFDMVVKATHCDPSFLGHALLSNYVRNNQIDLEKTRAAQPHLNAEELGECFILLPSEQEQVKISQFIERKLAKFDCIIEQAEGAVKLLYERRTALISAAVTGKIDVRKWKPESEDIRMEKIYG